MENTIDEGISSNEVLISRNIKDQLDETRKWTLFFAILGILGTGVLILAGISMFAASSIINQTPGMPFSGAILGSVYLVISLFYILPIYYLFKYSSSARKAVDSSDQIAFENSHKYMKLLFRFMGVITILMFFIYIALIISAFITATASGARPF